MEEIKKVLKWFSKPKRIKEKSFSGYVRVYECPACGNIDAPGFIGTFPHIPQSFGVCRICGHDGEKNPRAARREIVGKNYGPWKTKKQ